MIDDQPLDRTRVPVMVTGLTVEADKVTLEATERTGPGSAGMRHVARYHCTYPFGSARAYHPTIAKPGDLGVMIFRREPGEACWEYFPEDAPEARMTWTTEFPTKPGWYWVKNCLIRGDNPFPKKGPEVARVIPSPQSRDDLQYISFMDYGIPRRNSFVRDEIVSAEWYGPIEPPE
jgi:hypothetical protein